MKWYKKQLDKLKEQNPELKALVAEDHLGSGTKNSFDPQKNVGKRSIPSPVATSKLQRPKTDA